MTPSSRNHIYLNLTLPMWGGGGGWELTCFCRLLIFFSKSTFLKNLFCDVSNSLDPDQARHFVGPDLGLNCLQRLSEDGIIVGSELNSIISISRKKL